MFIHCHLGHITEDRCGKTINCPQSCPERAERIASRLESLRQHQRQLIDRHKDNPTAIYYEVVAAIQERIEAAEAAL